MAKIAKTQMVYVKKHALAWDAKKKKQKKREISIFKYMDIYLRQNERGGSLRLLMLQ